MFRSRTNFITYLGINALIIATALVTVLIIGASPAACTQWSITAGIVALAFGWGHYRRGIADRENSVKTAKPAPVSDTAALRCEATDDYVGVQCTRERGHAGLHHNDANEWKDAKPDNAAPRTPWPCGEVAALDRDVPDAAASISDDVLHVDRVTAVKSS